MHVYQCIQYVASLALYITFNSQHTPETKEHTPETKVEHNTTKTNFHECAIAYVRLGRLPTHVTLCDECIFKI